MSSRAAPTRAEYERLKEDLERICRELEVLTRRVEEQSHELTVQFMRIAEMQAILDEERIANTGRGTSGEGAMPTVLRPAHR